MSWTGPLNRSGTRTMLIDWFRVTPVSDGHPVALADSYDVSQKALDVSPAKGVLANDEGKGAQPKVTLLSKPEHGTLELGEDGSFRYTPKSGFRGIATSPTSRM